MPAPKGNKYALGNKGGKPETYKGEYVKIVNDYVDSCEDYYENIVKQENAEKGYKMYDKRLKVNLPTRQHVTTLLKCNMQTLNDWAGRHKEFALALGRLDTKQHDMLVKMSLGNEYNSTIAKLMLSSNHGYKEKSDITSNDQTLSLSDLFDATVYKESEGEV